LELQTEKMADQGIPRSAHTFKSLKRVIGFEDAVIKTLMTLQTMQVNLTYREVTDYLQKQALLWRPLIKVGTDLAGHCILMGRK
jgi:hypothetical protein